MVFLESSFSLALLMGHLMGKDVFFLEPLILVPHL